LCGEIKQIAIAAGENHGRLSAAGIVFKSSMESKLLFCSAGLTLNVAESLCKMLIWGQPKGLSTARYLTYHLPVEIFKRIGVRLFVMSVGAAVGTIIKPGIGNSLTVLVIDFVSMPILYGAINRAAGIR
jgi:hypothetical protein